ncbi:MAG: 6,7-dimethyl-8-ribityllumazine synthase [Bacteroidales bacterium]|nr:6,7-dimethyl-8-ribityllumazine synthase [Bacteroidales bacterium]MDD4821464.1 6,7-dimethyl-8-ribityllumazine synthase [Bacteroidales bacterium]
MATAYHNLSTYDEASVSNAEGKRFGIVVADWNSNITFKLLDGAIGAFTEHGVRPEDIIVKHVPGSFELVFAARQMAERAKVDAVIVLGCVVRGDTPHFDYVCQGVTQGIASLNLKYNIPFIFGMVTTNTMQQAEDRAGGIHGNKGVEGAITAIIMSQLFAE